MVIDFNSANSNARTSQQASTSASGKRDAVAQGSDSREQATQASNKPTDTAVQLSNQARQLQQAEARLRDLPDMDSERVASIRQAIADGSYQIDSGRIADRLLATEG